MDSHPPDNQSEQEATRDTGSRGALARRGETLARARHLSAVDSNLHFFSDAGGFHAPSPLVDARQHDLLCVIAFVHLSCGEVQSALALLTLAEREWPESLNVLRTLAYAQIADLDGERALATVEQLVALDDSAASQAPLMLLRSRALRLLGRWGEARDAFLTFTTIRNGG
jgi:tetratricopeptide (TPR) repeat protein